MRSGLLFIAILIFLIVAAGCTTTAPPEEARPPVAPVPNLLGNWTGSSVGYTGEKGFTDFGGDGITMMVTAQKDRIFQGDFLISNQSGTIIKTIEFGGAIGRDGMTLTIVERNGGYSFGTLVAPDEIELIHADDKEPSDVAIDSLKKS